MNLKMRFLLFLICHADKLVLHNTPFETYIKCVGSKAKINIRFESGCISGPKYGNIMINDKAGLTRDEIVTILKPMGKLLDEWNEFDDGIDGSPLYFSYGEYEKICTLLNMVKEGWHGK